ncbi:MAG: class B sortase, partial [Oscillospiraceae bacterium]
MLKAEIINLTSKLDFRNTQDTFVNAITNQLSFMNINLTDVTDISSHPETVTSDLAKSLSRANIIITIGGLGEDLNDSVKHSIIAGLSLQTLLHINTFNRLKKQSPQMSDEYLERITSYPKDAKIFECKGISGFALFSKEQSLICLPSDESDCKNIMSDQLLKYIAQITNSEYTTDRLLFPNVSIADAKNALQKLNNENTCVDCYKSIDGTVIVVSGNEGAVRATMLAATEFLKKFQPANPLIIKEKSNSKHMLGYQNTDKPKYKKRKTAYIILLVILLTISFSSLSYLGLYYYQAYQNENKNHQLQEELIHPDENVDAPKEILPKLKSIYAQNNDTVGWISIDNTNINYPVLRTDDNNFYLKKDFFKKDNRHGIPFADSRNDFENQSDNTVIYSHNMKDGQMFSDLINYRNSDFYKSHPIIDFDTIYDEGKYKIFSVFIANTRDEHGKIFDYHNGINFNTPEEFMEYVHNAKIRSLLAIPVDVNENDELLTLSTCTYEFKDGRLVVMARKLRDGEDENVDTNNVKTNPNALMPDIWYKLYGGEPPALSVFKYEPTEISESSDEISSSSEVSSSSEISSSSET